MSTVDSDRRHCAQATVHSPKPSPRRQAVNFCHTLVRHLDGVELKESVSNMVALSIFAGGRDGLLHVEAVVNYG